MTARRRYQLECLAATVLTVAGCAWLVGDKLHRTLREAFR
jgi:hypothetical protein